VEQVMTGSTRKARRGGLKAGTLRAHPRAFTLIDILVTLAVVSLLIGIMLPGLGRVREIARQVVCRSNLRQIGLGLVLYADGSRDRLPYSVYIDPQQQSENGIKYAPQEMMTLRLESGVSKRSGTTWDGFGLLFAEEVLPSREIFYCPSHHGDHSFADQVEKWLKPEGELVGNYQFRGQGPNGSVHLSFIEPSRAAIATDGIRTVDDYNHRVGLNVLRADLSLYWLSDPDGRIGDFVEYAGLDSFQQYSFDKLWSKFDEPTQPGDWPMFDEW
jgi:hypothetical protein